MKRFVAILVLVSGLAMMQIDQDTLQIISMDPTSSEEPRLEAVGDSTDISPEFRSKGAGNIHLDTGGSVQFRTPADAETKYTMFRISSAVANPVNNIFVAGQVSGQEPYIGTEGNSDADVSLDIIPKGSGRLTVNSINVPTISSTDTLTNKTLTAPVISAGSSSAGTWPKINSGSVLTTPEAGAIEHDGRNLCFTNAGSVRGYIPAKFWLAMNSTNTLTSSTSEQSLFDSVGTGTLTLARGTYFFETSVSLSSMSATSGNLAFDILGAGTAVLDAVLYECTGIDGATGTAATKTGSTMVTAQTPASVVTAGTDTTCQFACKGAFRITTAGTIIPSGTLVTAAAAVVAKGSYFYCYIIGSYTAESGGPWS